MSSLIFNNLAQTTIIGILVEVQNKLRAFYDSPVSVLSNLREVEELRMIEYNACHSLITRFKNCQHLLKVPRDIKAILDLETSDQKNRISINRIKGDKFSIFYWDGNDSYTMEIDEVNFNRLSSRVHKWMS